MAPCEPATVQSHFAITENMVGGLTTFTQFAQVRRRLLPSFEVSSGGECVNASIEEEFEGALLQIQWFPVVFLKFSEQ